MTNVSKHALDTKHQEQLFSQLAQLVHSSSKNETGAFLSELFTDSEQIMFIKPLAVVLLLSKQQSAYRISKTLKMSESTVSQIRLKYEFGEYDSIIKISKKKEFDSKQFWLTLDVLLRAGMPSRGKDRWKSLK